MKLVEHKQHKGMFYLVWPDGSMSDDFYNKTRAKDHAAKIEATMARRALEKAVGAFK
jgi:hypothetical protein